MLNTLRTCVYIQQHTHRHTKKNHENKEFIDDNNRFG